ncbi:hypothetical protein BGZ68_005767 [Mortierella alpina]|nr:hypothetical protein BGZ68_005767 [Mortierella alpina]
MSTAPTSPPLVPTTKLLTQDFFPGDHSASHGCPHLKSLKKAGEILNNYQLLARYSLHFKHRNALGILHSKDKKRPRSLEASLLFLQPVVILLAYVVFSFAVVALQ